MLTPIYNQRCIETNKDVRADFTVRMPDGDDITMSMWMKGEQERKIFSALSPMTEGLSRIKQMPYVIADQPTLTFVARQRGEAWTRPFVSVFEPHTAKNAPSRIREVRFPEVSATGEGSHTGIQVIQTDGTADWILSSDKAEVRCTTEGISAQAVYALYRQKGGQGEMAFLGGGTLLEAGDIRIEAAEAADVLLVKEAGCTPLPVRVQLRWVGKRSVCRRCKQKLRYCFQSRKDITIFVRLKKSRLVRKYKDERTVKVYDNGGHLVARGGTGGRYALFI